ncbi:MAG: hypothetical protein Q8Q08_08285 [Candidatus Omnitrophota bacterium]|nr:hypothetical protein [Candidatus Omnitrophota bacterium]MDZ4242097.1 hypothetical protein [Candidatus Omnitrophota bacterium]
MKRIERTIHGQVRVFGILFLAGAVLMTAAGCEPLRKKFVRKKKADQSQREELQPILDPIDYPDQMATPAELYRQHFAFWQVWSRDLLTDLEEGASDKRILFALAKVRVEVEEMGKLLTGSKQQSLARLGEQLAGVENDLKFSSAVRGRETIKRELESIGRAVREGFRFADVENSLAAASPKSP